MAIRNYDPNIRYGIHTVRITIQQWGYVGHITKKVGGNCKGIDVMDFDFEYDDLDLENDCSLQFDEGADYLTATLRDEAGNTLLVDGSARDFNRMIVAVEIIDLVKD